VLFHLKQPCFLFCSFQSQNIEDNSQYKEEEKKEEDFIVCLQSSCNEIFKDRYFISYLQLFLINAKIEH